MPDRPFPGPAKRLLSLITTQPSGQAGDAKFLCERCGDEMYRMNAVWRYPRCGFKTDCCGW